MLLCCTGQVSASVSYIESAFNPAMLPAPIPTIPGLSEWFTEFLVWSDDPGVVGFVVTVEVAGTGERERFEVVVPPGGIGGTAVFAGLPGQIRLISIVERKDRVAGPGRHRR